MSTLVEVLFLALVQGLTEWLPISSSGHLVVLQQLLGLEMSLLMAILLHFGTAVVILVYFRREVFEVLRAVKRGEWKSENGRLAWLVVLGNVPTALIGFAFYEKFVELFSNLAAVGVAFIATGIVLLFSRSTRRSHTLGVKEALLMGVAQGVAIIPGASRSGFTITTGLLLGVDKEKSFKFSFLLAVPAILGATVMEIAREREQLLLNLDLTAVFFGVFLAIVVGYVSLTFLWKTIARQKFHLFTYYCFAASLVLLFSQLVF